MKPKVKLKSEPTKKSEPKTVVKTQPSKFEPEAYEEDYFRQMVDEGRTDDEGESASSSSCPSGGDARAPDQVAEPKVGPPLPKPEVERENKQSRSVEALKKEARSARRILTHTLTARPASKQASKQASKDV